MKKKKLLAAAIVLCMVIQLLCACGKQKISMSDKVYVGVTCYDQNDTFLSELLVCFKEELNHLNKNGVETTVTVKNAAGSQRTQNDQVKELINAGCNVLCVNLVDRADPSEIIDVAKEHDVPIIFFNREPVAEDMRQWDRLYYVGADAKQSGVLQGELAVEMIRQNSQIDHNKDGKIQYVVLEGEAGHQDAIIRTENAVDTLNKNGIELEKLSYQIANWNRAQAQTKMTQMLAEYDGEIELVIANNDDMALGAIDALKTSHLKRADWPVVVGIDGTDVGLAAVASGEMVGTVYNDKEGQAQAMLDLAYALSVGDTLDDLNLENGKYIRLPYSKVGST